MRLSQAPAQRDCRVGSLGLSWRILPSLVTTDFKQGKCSGPCGYSERRRWMGDFGILESVAGMQIRDDGGLNQLESNETRETQRFRHSKFFEE